MFSLNATLPVFLVMVIGWALGQKGFLPKQFCTVADKLVFKVTLPVMLFCDMATLDLAHSFDAKFVLFCFAVTAIAIVVIWVLARRLLKDKTLVGEFVQASYRSSAAILGVAFIQNIYGTSGMAPLMIIGTVPLYNIAAVLILSFTGSESEGLRPAALKKSVKGILTNPIIIGIAAGMIASLFQVHFPAIISKTVNNIAVLATPLALIGLGAGFEGKKALAEIKPTLVCSFMKLMLWPALFLPLAALLGFRDEKMVALLVMLGSPTTVSCYIMAKNMKHPGILTSSVVVATTFLSSVTLTFWLYLLKSLSLI